MNNSKNHQKSSLCRNKLITVFSGAVTVHLPSVAQLTWTLFIDTFPFVFQLSKIINSLVHLQGSIFCCLPTLVVQKAVWSLWFVVSFFLACRWIAQCWRLARWTRCIIFIWIVRVTIFIPIWFPVILRIWAPYSFSHFFFRFNCFPASFFPPQSLFILTQRTFQLSQWQQLDYLLGFISIFISKA